MSSIPAVVSAAVEYTGLSPLALSLALGVVPEDFKKSYVERVEEIAALLEQEPPRSCPRVPPFFRTDNGVLYHGDCVEVLKSLPCDSVDLVFADPPFNLRKKYDAGIDDGLSMSSYITWSYQWIDECVRVLKPGGSLYIYNIPKWGAYFARHLDAKLTQRAWIAVNMKFGLPLAGRLYPAHYSLLYYVKGVKPTVYNGQRIPAETCRHCGGELHDYGGYKSKMNPEGVNLSDVWSDIYPVRHKGTKKREYNELSVKMLDRVISMSSNPGDLVLDPFGGSGTTYAVAELLGRRWIGAELGDCEVIASRLSDLSKDKALLDQAQKEKGTLFTTKARELRKKNGFWLPEDFE